MTDRMSTLEVEHYLRLATEEIATARDNLHLIKLTGLTEPELAALRAYLRAIQEQWGLQLVDVILFGSKARGDIRPDSDVDILVILDGADAEVLSDVRGLAFDIWLDHHVLLSIRAFSLAGWQALAARQSLFYRNAIRDGISLHARMSSVVRTG